MTALIIVPLATLVIGFGLGVWVSECRRHRNDGSSLRDLDKYSGRF